MKDVLVCTAERRSTALEHRELRIKLNLSASETLCQPPGCSAAKVETAGTARLPITLVSSNVAKGSGTPRTQWLLQMHLAWPFGSSPLQLPELKLAAQRPHALYMRHWTKADMRSANMTHLRYV